MQHFMLQKKKSVVNVEIRLHNRLQVGIKSAESFKDFKIKLRTSLSENSFYSVQEFLLMLMVNSVRLLFGWNNINKVI
jgi:hypothetical protein